MTTKNINIMRQAQDALENKWGSAIGAIAIYLLIIGSIFNIPIIGYLLTLLIFPPIFLGLSTYVLLLSTNQFVKFNTIFSGFLNYGKSLSAFFLIVIMAFFKLLLLIVPGVIALLAYSQTFFILAEEPQIQPMDALKKSKIMMQGYKWKYFCLKLRFIGWALLCILTFGLGFILLIPYIFVANAKFYEDIKAIKINNTSTSSIEEKN